ncbi:MBL fold metallo-hydrolase [Streptomyces smaragdinus]|uniref:MBL fold metallo-hydrolase n=1 Tax=Streptomyces smaragdinus TaxID=2585196 RepID=UPI001886AAD9|nr:MBL fold metallo-hydrolase [Streptomyces smaragdinus]
MAIESNSDLSQAKAPEKLAPHTYGVESLPEAASNFGIVVGEEAVVVVDSRLTPALGHELRGWLADNVLGEKRPILINSHFHGDHWFGNPGFKGDTIIASRWTQEKLRQDWEIQVERFCELRPHQTEDFRSVTPVLPNIGIEQDAILDLGGTSVRVQCVRHAHSPGDVIVWSDDDRVAFAGDLVVNGHWPAFPHADYQGWLAVLTELADSGVRTVVPGHGPIGGVEVVRTMIDCLRFLEELASRPEAEWDGLVAASPYADWLHPIRVHPAIKHIRNELSE